MKLHEHQAKTILARYGVAVPEGRAAFSVDEAAAAAADLIARTGQPTVVVKAQIHAGGRGKGGGIKVVTGTDAAREAARTLLGMTLVTPQTGPEGRVVRRLLVEQGLGIAREIYLGAVVDRERGRVAFMACAEGGMEIEEVATRSPEKILREHVDPGLGLQPWQARRLAYGLGLKGDGARSFAALALALGRAVGDLDCSLCEINPLVVTTDGRVLALDAKLNLDDNAAFRHKDWADLRDTNEEDPAELEAKAHDLSYISLHGTIGCMVNGAGLAMATMDIIQQAGGEPANFLDVGGGATADKVTQAFKILSADARVRGIFINIFGGIMKCDTIASGVTAAVREVGLQVPLVVRLEGTNVELGRRILMESDLAGRVVAATDMADGAQKIVALVRAEARS
jgi:succinyl-CoA synthetase beta subunit